MSFNHVTELNKQILNSIDTRPLCEAETDQTDRQKEVMTETRSGAGREKDIMRKGEPETENLAETAKEI